MFYATPDKTVNKLVEAINTGDIDLAVSLYENFAKFVVQPAEIVEGTKNIQDSLSMMILMKPKLTTVSYKVVEADGVALYQSSWKMVAADESGREVVQSGNSADILRFHPRHGWRILIDNPWGCSIING